MMKLLHLFYEAPDTPVEIHPTAVVHPEAKLGKNVSIGPNVTVSRGAVIGDNSKLMAGVYIGKFAEIGADSLFHPNVCIGDRVKIGARAVMHHGVSIGADGFSFVTETPDNIEQARQSGEITGGKEDQVVYKIPSLGMRANPDDPMMEAAASINILKNKGVQAGAFVIVLCLAYAALFEVLGYVLVSAIIAAIIMWLIGKRDVKQILLVSILVPLLMWFVFYKLLTVNIPMGVLQPLRTLVDMI